MIKIHLNYNDVQIDISGEVDEIVSVVTALNEVVDRTRKAIEALAKTYQKATTK